MNVCYICKKPLLEPLIFIIKARPKHRIRKKYLYLCQDCYFANCFDVNWRRESE